MYLQLFAERTEEPTPKRLAKAREEGQVVKSNDLVAGAGLVVITMALQGLGPPMVEQLWQGMTGAFAGLEPMELTPTATGSLLQEWTYIFLRAVLPTAAVLMVVGVVLGTLQTRFIFTLKPLVPRFSALNPVTGLTRMFSLRSLTELIKGLLKLTLIGYIAYREVKRVLPSIPNLMSQSVPAGVAAIAGILIDVLQSIGWAMLVLGLADYAYQYWEFRRSVRMTKDEIKREHREQEGAPELKSKQRQRARELAMRRKALKDVPQADVVVTNPTHYAVALMYDAAVGSAPKVLAKGADILAQRIKIIARENDVPMVENRTLARGLYSSVEVGKFIPPEYYQAVAEVLAFVYSIRRQNRAEEHGR